MDDNQEKEKPSVWQRLLSIDRRIIFILMALAVIIPLLVPLNFPPGEATKPVKNLYRFIEELPEGSVVMLAFDFGPSSMPELYPMALAIIKHCFDRNLRVVGLSLYTTGPPMCEDALREAAEDAGKQGGVDYVNLGYKPGFTAVLLGMATDIQGTFKDDYSGRSLSTMPMMADIRSYSDIALIIDFASSSTPEAWIQIVGARYHQDIAAGVTAVMGTDFYSYLQSGQLVGLLVGLKGAAEYEGVSHHPGQAMKLMSPQAIAHCVIIVFVLMGNTAYFFIRRRERRRS